MGLLAGGALATLALALIALLHLGSRGLAIWLLPPLAFPVPVLALAARWRKQTSADAPQRLLMVLKSVMEPRNPGVIPLWSPWFGRNG
jgi:hypothetical protein